MCKCDSCCGCEPIKDAKNLKISPYEDFVGSKYYIYQWEDANGKWCSYAGDTLEEAKKRAKSLFVGVEFKVMDLYKDDPEEDFCS